MNRVLKLCCLLAVVCVPISSFAATTPLFSDNFSVSANNNSVNFENTAGRQAGSRAPLLYTEQDQGQDNYSQVGRTGFENRLFMAASGSANLVKVSPNSNFNVSPGTGGVFYIEFEVNPVLTSVTNTNATASAWAAIKFGSVGQNKTVNDADGFGILFRGETDRHFQNFDGGTVVSPAAPNDFYTTSTVDTFHAIRLELRRVTPGPNLFDGTPVEIKCFVDSGMTPIFTYVRNAGFTDNFISLVSETEGSGGDGITRHAFDTLRVTSAPAPSVALSLPGGTSIEPNTVFAASVVETGVTQKVEYYVGASKVGEDITPTDGFSFNYAGLATGNYSLTAVTTDLFGLTATSAPVNIVVTRKPLVSITSPVDGVTLAVGSGYTINAAASDTDGTIAKVEFFINGSKVGEDTTGVDGYTYAVASVASGTYVLKAVATDNMNAQTTSATVRIFATVAPEVTLLSPAPNTVLDEPATLNLDARAIDPDGFVAKVEFFANGVKIAEDRDAGGGFNASIANFPAGVYSIFAVATDSVGYPASTTPIQFTVRARPKFDSIAILSPTTALTGQTVSGTASSSGATIIWNWGDGSSSTGNSVSHVYTAAGAYSVLVTATSAAGVPTSQTLTVFIGQDLFGAGGTGGSDGVQGVLIGGSGIGASQGAGVKVSMDYARRARTSIRGTLKNLAFPSGLTQTQLENQSSTLRFGAGDAAIPLSFSLDAKGRGKATGIKKIELSVLKKSFSFYVQGQAALTDLLESQGAGRDSNKAVVRVPATLQVGTQFFLVLTFEFEFTGKGTRGTGVLRK